MPDNHTTTPVISQQADYSYYLKQKLAQDLTIWELYYGVPYPQEQKPKKSQEKIAKLYGYKQENISRILRRLKKQKERENV